MKKNLGNADKILRVILAVVAAVLYFGGYVSGTAAYIVIAAGAILLLTALVNFCPLYALFGIRTCKIK